MEEKDSIIVSLGSVFGMLPQQEWIMAPDRGLPVYMTDECGSAQYAEGYEKMRDGVLESFGAPAALLGIPAAGEDVQPDHVCHKLPD
jgi:hypothetical protein